MTITHSIGSISSDLGTHIYIINEQFISPDSLNIPQSFSAFKCSRPVVIKQLFDTHLQEFVAHQQEEVVSIH